MFLTFGKYRNKSVKEVIDKDRQYSEWLITQPWFTIKHKDLYREFMNELEKNIKPVIIDKNSFIAYTDGACKHNGSDKARAGIGIHFSIKNGFQYWVFR